MPTIPDHNAPEVKESEVKVFRQKYFIVDDEDDTGRVDYKLHEARIEVLADDDGVFIESKEDGVTEQLSIPTSDLAIKVAEYILRAYQISPEWEAPPTRGDDNWHSGAVLRS
jgi:hypothetical protein